MIASPQRWTKLYWAKSPLHQTPLMHEVISRDRFWALFPLVFSWDLLEGEEYFNKKFKEAYSPSSYMALDELMCGYKGRTKNKVYMPRKRIRTGIKIFSINDSTPEATYLWDFTTYLKEDTRRWPAEGAGVPLGSNVRGLLEYADSVLPAHCFITADRYFGSLENGNALNAKNRGFLLSCRADRPGSLWGPLTTDLDPGETRGLQNKETGITAFAFKDRRATLLLLSNGVRSWGLEASHTGYDKAPSGRQLEALPDREQKAWSRPLVRDLYNYSMRGSDVFAQRMESFRYNRRQKTWKRAVRLYHFSMALCNAHILYNMVRKDEKRESHYSFLQSLVQELSPRISEMRDPTKTT